MTKKISFLYLIFLLFACGINKDSQNSLNSNNQKTGLWVENQNDTILKSKYENGIKVGYGEIIIGDSVIIKGEYKNGKLNGNWTKYVNGKKRKDYRYASGMLIMVSTYKDDKIVKTESYSPTF